MKPPPFDFVAPDSLDGVLAALAEGGEDTKLIAGGQSLIPLLAFRVLRPSLLVDLNRIPALAGLRELDDGGLAIGAMTRTHELEVSPLVEARWPLAREAAPHIGHRQIRNRGTVGGSLAHADPAAELAAVAVASRASLIAHGPRGERRIPAAEFFATVFTTALAHDEVLTEIRVPPRPPGLGVAFVEVSRRPGDFALAGAAATVVVDDGRCVDATLALVGVGATPVPVREAAELAGTAAGEREVEAVAEAAREAANPGSDTHASADDRRQLAAVVARRALLAAAERARP